MIMKKTTILLTLLIAIIGLDSCSDNETYADKLKREGVAINSFIAKHGINVISEEQFASQDSTTDITKNQFVYFTNTGVYLQIMNKGCGTKIKKGEITTVLCRFTERNLLSDTIQLTNNSVYTSGIVDKMIVANTSVHRILLPQLKHDGSQIQNNSRTRRMARPPTLREHRPPKNRI